jgi:ribonuclease G
MTKEMIVSSNGHETMVAILEDDLVAEDLRRTRAQRGVVGNVYKGRVSKVLPGMQSSFIDLGSSATAFCTSPTSSTPRRVRQARVGRRRGRRGRQRPKPKEEPRAEQQRIEDLLKEGQEILVQVVKEPLGTKGARLTSPRHHGGAFPRVHADGRPRRRLTKDRFARRAQPLRGIVREFREAHGFTAA